MSSNNLNGKIVWKIMGMGVYIHTQLNHFTVYMKLLPHG